MHDMSTAPFFCAGDSAQETADWLEKLAEAAQGHFRLPQSEEPEEAARALGLIAQIARDHEPRHLPQVELEVTVVEASNLAPMDANGKSDPYAVLHCGAVQCRTRCLPKTLNPQWTETFRFEVVSGPASVLQIDVYNRNVFFDDDFVGTLRLKVEDLSQVEHEGTDLDLWHELQPRTAKDTHVKGHIHIRANVRPLLNHSSTTDDLADNHQRGEPYSARSSALSSRSSAISYRSTAISAVSREIPSGGRLRVSGAPSASQPVHVSPSGRYEARRGSVGSLPPEMVVVQQVSSAVSYLKSLYESSQQTAARVMEENNALRAGLRSLFADAEFASCRARSVRKCVLTVREVEARGRDPRRGGALGDVRVVVQYGTLAERTDVRRGVASPRWEGLNISFPIDTWEDDLFITLVDASERKQPIGRCKIRMLDLDTAEDTAEAGVVGGAHDAWHQAMPTKRRASSAAGLASSDFLGLLGLSGKQTLGVGASAAEGSVASAMYDEPLALRVACDWRYLRTPRATTAAGGAPVALSERLASELSSTSSTVHAEASVGSSAGTGDAALREASAIAEAVRARMAESQAYVESLNGMFAALKQEFAPEYSTYCAHKIGVLTVTVMAASELPASQFSAPPDSYVALECGPRSAETATVRRSLAPEWRESFEFDVTDPAMQFTLTVRQAGSTAMQLLGGSGKSTEIGVVRASVLPLLDQQPRMRRDPIVQAALKRTDTGRPEGTARCGFLRYELRFRAANAPLGVDAAISEDDGTSRITAKYTPLLQILREPEPWLAVALCETAPVERADRLANAVVQLLSTCGDLSEGSPVTPWPQLMVLLRVVLAKELDETTDEKLVFRRNSTATKLATRFVIEVGKAYLRETLGPPVSAICEAGSPMGTGSGDGVDGDTTSALEVDPSRLTAGSASGADKENEAEATGAGAGGGGDGAPEATLERNRTQLRLAASVTMDAIFSSLERVPGPVRELCALISRLATDRFGSDSHAAVDALSGIFFLRVVVPCLANPFAHGIVPSMPSRAASRGLVLTSKIVMSVANGRPLGKEPFMMPFNDSVAEHMDASRLFFSALAADDHASQSAPVPISPASSEARISEVPALREAHKLLSELADRVYESAETPAALRSVQQVLTDLGPADDEEASGGPGLSADWSPETVVSRVVAVKDKLVTLLSAQEARAAEASAVQPPTALQPPRDGATPLERLSPASSQKYPAAARQTPPLSHTPPPPPSPPLSLPAAPPAPTTIVSRLKMGRLQSACGSSLASRPPPCKASDVAAAAAAHGELSSLMRPRIDSTEVASLAASAVQTGGLAQSAIARRGHRAKNKRGSVDDMAIAMSTTAMGRTGAAEGNGEADSAEIRAIRLEAAELRRQLHVALTENKSMRSRLRDAEGALQQMTAEHH